MVSTNDPKWTFLTLTSGSSFSECKFCLDTVKPCLNKKTDPELLMEFMDTTILVKSKQNTFSMMFAYIRPCPFSIKWWTQLTSKMFGRRSKYRGTDNLKFKGISKKKESDRVNMEKAHSVNTRLSEIPLGNTHKLTTDFFWGKVSAVWLEQIYHEIASWTDKKSVMTI